METSPTESVDDTHSRSTSAPYGGCAFWSCPCAESALCGQLQCEWSLVQIFQPRHATWLVPLFLSNMTVTAARLSHHTAARLAM